MYEYPDNCLKGIPRNEWVRGRSVTWLALQPPDSAQSKDGWYESSINWELDDGALPQLLNQPHPRKENELHFIAGAVRIPRVEIDEIIDHFEMRDVFSYEPDPLPDNKYHGNLLLHEQLHKGTGEKKQDKGLILGAIAKAAKLVRREGE
jgi:hypothetical protein